jgi:hypothetical protein
MHARDFFCDQHHGEKSKPIAAVGFRDHAAIKAQFAHFPDEIQSKILFFIILGRGRRDFVLGKIAGQLTYGNQLVR